MKKLFLVVSTYSKIIFSDRMFVAAMIFFPVLLGMIYASAAIKEELISVRAAYVDNDSTKSSMELYKRLNSHEGLEVFEATLEEAKELLKGGKVEAVLVLKEGFEKSINQGETKPFFSILTLPSSFSSGFLSEVLASDISLIASKRLSSVLILDKYNKLGLSTNGISDRVEDYYKSLTDDTPLFEVDYVEVNANNKPDQKSVTLNPQKYMPYGGLLMFIMFFLMFGSGWMIDGKENGTLKRIKSMKNGFMLSFWGMFLCLVLSGIFQSVVFILSGLALGTLIVTGILQFAILFVFILCASSISMFLSSVFKTSLQLQAFTPVFILLTSFAGSCFWDISLLSKSFETISLFTPQGVTLKALQAVSSGLTTSDWIIYSGILVMFSAVLTLSSYKLSSKQ